MTDISSEISDLQFYLKPYILRNSRWSAGCQIPLLAFRKEYKLQMFKKKAENEGEREKGKE